MLDMSLIPDKIKPLLQNYKINLVDVHNITNFSTFKTSLGPLLEFMKIRKDKTAVKNYITKYEDFLNTSTDELFEVIARLLDAEWIIDKKHKNNKKGVEYTMCTGMKEWLEEVRSEGESHGIQTVCNVISELRKNTPISAIASKYAIDETQILMIMHSINSDVSE